MKRMPLTLRAVLQRLNRKLEEDGQAIKAERRGRGSGYALRCVVDTKRGEVLTSGLDATRLVAMAHEHGVIEPWEEVR